MPRKRNVKCNAPHRCWGYIRVPDCVISDLAYARGAGSSDCNKVNSLRSYDQLRCRHNHPKILESNLMYCVSIYFNEQKHNVIDHARLQVVACIRLFGTFVSLCIKFRGSWTPVSADGFFGKTHIVPTPLKTAKDCPNFPLRNLKEATACRLANTLEVCGYCIVVEWTIEGHKLRLRRIGVFELDLRPPS